ncbi:Helix-turn-helix domain-containing protein [Corynebacterium coyleae]|uniref:Winged helix-turn-helix domain-containing protein n=1 Tax=Corynebacterium coyleae TaxID=53374 RepID=A0ABX8KVG6_9CORY|nr:winged helix-turn-helix domain-containing protein [Corynebacterium coyleae]QXB18250.1 winged helix-turn-helix domain-containing protein [Corynebacterium coyleae]WJY79727.1 Helix-turn-helix domain protein [Corynebacterium coyleae]SEB90811.1 Helix-turn-helix domain-containing protein [Corynebacterium coyleae]
MQPIEARLSDLEARVAALEHASPPEPSPLPGSSKETEQGRVSFAGDITLPTGTYSYEWIRPTAWITDQPWDDAMDRIAALAHPVRGAILRHLLAAPASVTELVESELVSSTGTAYHHLKELQAAGWVRKQGGMFEIPPARVIPLMAIVIAGEDH